MTRRSPLVALSVLGLALGLAAADARAAGPDDDARARRRSPVVEVFERARDAVVNISSTEIVVVRSRSPFDGFFDDHFHMPERARTRQYTRSSVGSGFVVHPDGYIVTNAHVIAQTVERKVTFADGTEYDAEIVAADPARDLAVLKIEADRPLPIVPLGRSDDLMVGETVIAIGNPLGFQHTCTAGVVSAVDRQIDVSPELMFRGLVQTDASINPGNSGGPLLNVLGELIGVNSAIRGDAQNIGFAIPVDQLRAVLPDLLDVERRYGFETGLAVDALSAPRVVSVEPGSPAADAGIRPGDVLESIDGRAVRGGIDFDIALIERQAGDEIPLGLRRGDQPIRARLRLAPRPRPDGAQLALTRLGLEIFPLPAEAARELRLRASRLMVAATEPGGPGDEAGVQRRDILLAIGRRHIRDAEELGRVLEQLDPGDVVTVQVLRVERGRKVQRSGPIRVR